MPSWLVALLAAVLGAFVGGIGAALGTLWMASRSRQHELREEFLTTRLPILDSTKADEFHSGSHRGDLRIALNYVRETTASLSRKEQVLGVRLAEAWKHAVFDDPAGVGYQEAPVVGAEKRGEIDRCHTNLRLEIERRVRPVGRWRGRVKWPSL